MTKNFDIYEYWERNKLIGKYGILYLDKELIGIAKTDFVMVGVITHTLKKIILKTIFSANDPQKVAVISLAHYCCDIGAIIKTFIQCLELGFNLIILDDFECVAGDNENNKALMNAINRAQDLGATFVGISVLELPLQEKYDIIPNETAFIGSHDPIIQATQVIMFAPANDGDAIQGYGTWCCIRKNRNGGVKNQAAKMFYLPDTETYKDSYDLYTINYSGTKAEQITMDGIEISQKPKRFG